MISERLEPSEALPKINVDASFVSEMASRALETPSHSFTHSDGLKMHPSRAVSQGFPRSRYDGSNAQGCEKGALAFVRVPQSGALEPAFVAYLGQVNSKGPTQAPRDPSRDVCRAMAERLPGRRR